jgi:hypothetical protein
MLSQKEDTANYFGTLFLMVLIFIVFASCSNKSAEPISLSSHYQPKSELSLNITKAVVADAIQLPSVQNSCLQLLHNYNINLFNETCKISVDNSKITQRFIVLKETELLIKPLSQLWLYFLLLPPDTKEPRILS